MRKIEEAFVKSLNRIFFVKKISKFKFTNETEFEKIKDDLYCPECYQAQLTFVARHSGPYLKTKNNSSHGEDCSLQQNVMSDKERKEYMSTCTIDVINDDVEKLRKFLNDKPISTDAPQNIENDADEKEDVKPLNRKKNMPRKRIDLPLSEDDYDVIKYFYGKVNTRFVHLDAYDLSLLKIMSLDNTETYLTIKITKNVYQYMDRKFLTDMDNTDFFYLGSIYKKKDENRSTARKSYLIQY
ncbi:MAG: hypothetical protein HFJ98_06815 [Eubacterium sp.]|nr:hypothetical protein [Eubacterium sp.]